MTYFILLPPSGEVARSDDRGQKVQQSSLCSQRQFIKQVDSSVGYFACAQYDELFFCRDEKNSFAINSVAYVFV